MDDSENAATDALPDAADLHRRMRWRYRIPSTAYVRPCLKIAEEAIETGGGFASVADRYVELTAELPLAGGAMMRAGSDGEIALTARLRAAAPWLESAIAVIDRQLRIQNWAGRPWIAWRPLCLAGAPGTGKSHLARLIGTLAGAGHGTLDLAGTSDNRTLEGTARGWNSAQPCWPALMMHQTLTANPVLVLEELDKAGGSGRNGKPLETLLTMIEAETAARYYDKCLLAPVNLSHICWILTCNSADGLPAPLRSRLDIVEVAGPGPEHFDALVRTILSDLAGGWQVPPAMMPDIPSKALVSLRKAFARTHSVRRLRRHIESIVAALIPAERGPSH